MNQTTLTHDALDGLLSDFFKSAMKHPWPAAPATPMVHAARASVASAPRNESHPPVAARDSGNRARYTLAASVAMLLGTCWTLSTGFQPGDRPPPRVTPGNPVNMNAIGASDPAALKELKKDNAEKGNGNAGFVPPKIDLP